MITLLLAASLALGARAQGPDHQHGPDCPHSQAQAPVAPPPVIGEVPWAGIPLAALPALGLGEPTLDAHRSAWRAPLPQGGFVRLMHYPDVRQAKLGFSMQKLSASTRALPSLTWEHSPERDVEAVGDEAGMLVMRDGNVLLIVRDHGEQAGELARQLQAAMVAEAPEGDIQERDLGGRIARWDSCGRLLD
jgi:hypothetical protein